MGAGRSVSLPTAVPPDRIAKPGPAGISPTSLFIGVAQLADHPSSFHVSFLQDPPIPAALHVASCRPDRRKAGRLTVQGAATTGKAGVGHEVGVGAGGSSARRNAAVAAVGLEHPALRLVIEIGDHDLVQDLPMDGQVLDRHQRLDPTIQVARHPVRR
jgi:hypothetical protein